VRRTSRLLDILLNWMGAVAGAQRRPGTIVVPAGPSGWLTACRPAGRATVAVALAALAAAGVVRAAHATDLSYTLMSPAFGGSDPAALQTAEYDKGLQQARAVNAAAAAQAAAQAAAAANPTQQFASAIVSQLNSLVARDVALQIANSAPGQAGTIQSGNVSVTYVNSDGQLNISIATPTGSTTLSLPTGD